MPQNEHQLFN